MHDARYHHDRTRSQDPNPAEFDHTGGVKWPGSTYPRYTIN